MTRDQKEKVFDEMGRLSAALYDAAIIDAEGAAVRRFQNCNLCNDSYSVTKAFVMTGIGLLWDEKALKTTDRVIDFFPDLKGKILARDARWANVTIDQALTHFIGYGHNFFDIDVEDMTGFGAGDFLEVAMKPLDHDPGTFYCYTDAAFYILARVIEAVTGRTADLFLRQRLLNPLKFREAAWTTDPAGHTMGGTGLYATSMDVAKLGFLYLTGGVWEGKRLLSEAWTKLAEERRYALNPMAGGRLIGKGGMYGQMVLYSPGGGFAMAWHGAHVEQDALIGLAASL